jgi:aldose sugar dehydrogenase
MLLCNLVGTLTFFPSQLDYDNFDYSAYASEISSGGNGLREDRPYAPSGTLEYEYQNSSQPIINDPKLKLELVSEGLQLPTQMAFLGPDDILVLEKDTGAVKRIVNGVSLEEPVLDVNVATAYERGILGIAIAENDIDNDNDTMQRNYNNVYLYYTESEQDANDDCSSSTSCTEENGPLGNRLYKYELVDNKLVNQKLLLDLPASPGGSHNGGSISIGPDNNMYIPIGEISYEHGQISNNDDGPPPDGRGGILRVTQQGEAVGVLDNGDEEDDDGENNEDDSGISGILGDGDPLNKYYAYGIRNSFGIDFDPVSGSLWDTENGPNYGDEINRVEPGFNSGWNRVQGMWEDDEGNMGDAILSDPEGLESFEGKGKYSPPELTWKNRIGPTALKFLDSEGLGREYTNDIFVSDYHGGNIYHFDLEWTRTELLLSERLQDRIVDNPGETEQHIFGQGFGAITDMEVGPDGYLYILSNYRGTGDCNALAFTELCLPDSSKNGVLFRIVPNTT